MSHVLVNEVCGGRESGRREEERESGRRDGGGGEGRGEGEGKRRKEKMVKGIAGGVGRKGHYKGMHKAGGKKEHTSIGRRRVQKEKNKCLANPEVLYDIGVCQQLLQGGHSIQVVLCVCAVHLKVF